MLTRIYNLATHMNLPYTEKTPAVRWMVASRQLESDRIKKSLQAKVSASGKRR